MKKSEWSDNELEQLLRQMPKIQDHRDPRDIYQSLSLKAKKRKTTAWIVPSIASVAAVLLLLLLAPNIWQGIFPDSNTVEDKGIIKEEGAASKELARITQKNNGTSDTNTGSNELKMMATTNETAIYEEDVVDQKVITYHIPDGNAQILVPISIIVPNENKNWLELYLEYAEKLTENQWGLSEYYPLNAKLAMTNENTLNVDVPEGHIYGDGSSNEIFFMDIMQGILNGQNNIQKITFTTESKPGIMFGNYGKLNELNLEKREKRAYFIFNPNNQNLPFLVPSIDYYSDIETALQSMLIDNDQYGLKPSLPSNFIFKVDSSSKERLILTFENNPEFTNDATNTYAIEAILLTAKEFGYKEVKFENAPITQIGRFNLQNEIKVPVAPNKVNVQ